MSGQRYTLEFKDEAIKLITERGYSVTDDVVPLIRPLNLVL